MINKKKLLRLRVFVVFFLVFLALTHPAAAEDKIPIFVAAIPDYPYLGCLGNPFNPVPYVDPDATIKNLNKFLEEWNQRVRKERRRKGEQPVGVPIDWDKFSDLVSLYEHYGKKYGVNWVWAVFQMAHETGFLTFTGGVKKNDNNFAGLAAHIPGQPGVTYDSTAAGIEAHIQHLAAAYSLKDIPLDKWILPKAGKANNKALIDFWKEKRSWIRERVCVELEDPAAWNDLGKRDAHDKVAWAPKSDYFDLISRNATRFSDFVASLPPVQPTQRVWYRTAPKYNPKGYKQDAGFDNPNDTLIEKFTASGSRLRNTYRWYSKQHLKVLKDMKFEWEFDPPPEEIIPNQPFPIYLTGMVTNIAGTPFAEVRKMVMVVVYDQSGRTWYDEWGRVILEGSNAGETQRFGRNITIPDSFPDKFKVYVSIGECAAHVEWEYIRQ